MTREQREILAKRIVGAIARIDYVPEVQLLAGSKEDRLSLHVPMSQTMEGHQQNVKELEKLGRDAGMEVIKGSLFDVLVQWVTARLEEALTEDHWIDEWLNSAGRET